MVMGKVQAVAGGQMAAQSAAIPKALSAEDISLFMDGELQADRVESVCACMRDAEGVAAWTHYHVIGDALRGSGAFAPGFSARFAKLLADEPTVLAPPRQRSAPTAVAWAAAATVAAVSVVGWVALTTMSAPPTAVATAKRAAVIRAADARPAVDNEYLLVHQEYSPTVAIQGVRPYLRAVAASEQDARQ
jgi:sigma-E factor negative regulatory protein RseA